jgi:hypothetical protein
MEKEIINVLGELSAITMVGIVLIYVARIMLSRSKSDTETIKVFSDLLSGAFKDVKESVASHGGESETRHFEIVGVLRQQMELTRTLMESFSIRDGKITSSVDNLSNLIDTHIQKVDTAGSNIMDKVQPLDQVLGAIHSELKNLRESVDAHLQDSVKFRNDVVVKTEAMEKRLLQVEKRATQETDIIESKVEPENTVIEKPKGEEKHNAESNE